MITFDIDTSGISLKTKLKLYWLYDQGLDIDTVENIIKTHDSPNMEKENALFEALFDKIVNDYLTAVYMSTVNLSQQMRFRELAKRLTEQDLEELFSFMAVTVIDSRIMKKKKYIGYSIVLVYPLAALYLYFTSVNKTTIPIISVCVALLLFYLLFSNIHNRIINTLQRNPFFKITMIE